jgi:hypothetical protein
VRQWTKRLAYQWAAKVVQWRLRVVPIWRKSRAGIGSIAITLFAIAAGFSALYFPKPRETLNAFQPIEAILSQLGATFGTIFALLLTLSIIPIQRAAETWSPSIVRLYRRDPSTYITFIVLGVLCAASFMFAVKGLADIPSSIILAVAFGALGLSLDLLRWYQGHVCQLLDPAQAVGLTTRYARQTIDRIQGLVTRVATLQHRMLTPEKQRETSVEHVETVVYPRVSGYPQTINFWINDLAEIAGKATARGEKFLASAAVNAISEITKHFLSVRKRNLMLMPAPDGLFLGPVHTNSAHRR